MSADALQTLRRELARLHELAGFPSLDTVFAVLANHGVAIAQDKVAAVLTAATLPGQEATLHVAAALADRAGNRALGRDRERDRFVYLWADAAAVPLGPAARPLTAPAPRAQVRSARRAWVMSTASWKSSQMWTITSARRSSGIRLCGERCRACSMSVKSWR